MAAFRLIKHRTASAADRAAYRIPPKTNISYLCKMHKLYYVWYKFTFYNKIRKIQFITRICARKFRRSIAHE